MRDDLVFVPCVSLIPNQVSNYNQVFRRSNGELKPLVGGKRLGNEPLVRKSHNFKISENANRTLKKKINWLYYLSKKRTIKTYSGKQIFNFRMAFITLTLPTPQRTPTKEVTSKLFHQFIIEIKQRTKMENYVWRLEFQKNRNVHYHIVTDTYLDYFLALKVWNRILKKEGYITDYKAKFSNMSLSEYNNLVNPKGKTDFNVIAKRYAKGCGNNWEQPNSVDVKSVVSKENIANYIAKYFTKKSSGESECNEHDTPENSENIRLWFCSRTLSKLKAVSGFIEEIDNIMDAIRREVKNIREVSMRYVRLIYFDIKNGSVWIQKEVNHVLKSYAYGLNYKAAD